MKRELLCITCGRESISRYGIVRNFPASIDGPAEYVRHVEGDLIVDRPEADLVVNGEVFPQKGPCVCDVCVKPLPFGSRAVARTIGMGSSLNAPDWHTSMIVAKDGAS